MAPRKRIQNKITIKPLYLLNATIEELYEKEYIGVRVFLNLKSVKVKNLAEFREIILNRREKENEEKLERFGLKSVQEINDLYHRANVKIPEVW